MDSSSKSTSQWTFYEETSIETIHLGYSSSETTPQRSYNRSGTTGSAPLGYPSSEAAPQLTHNQPSTIGGAPLGYPSSQPTPQWTYNQPGTTGGSPPNYPSSGAAPQSTHNQPGTIGGTPLVYPSAEPTPQWTYDTPGNIESISLGYSNSEPSQSLQRTDNRSGITESAPIDYFNCKSTPQWIYGTSGTTENIPPYYPVPHSNVPIGIGTPIRPVPTILEGKQKTTEWNGYNNMQPYSGAGLTGTLVEGHRTAEDPEILPVELFFRMTANGFRIMKKEISEEGEEVYSLAESTQRLWDSIGEQFSRLEERAKSMFNTENICFLTMGRMSQNNGDTHFLVDFNHNGPGIRYICRNYEGICTWYVDTNAKHVAIPLKYVSHPFYKKELVPQSGSIHATLEKLMRASWNQRHQNCNTSHFTVHIYLHGNPMDPDSRASKFTTHRLCGYAFVADLFHVIQGGQPVEPRLRDWQSIGEITFDYGIRGELNIKLENSWTHQDLKQKRIRIQDMEWFNGPVKRGRKFVWLVPLKGTDGVFETRCYQSSSIA